MFEECAPSIPVARLIGRSGFGDAVGSVKADASDDIQEIPLLGVCLMCNDATVCGGRIWLKFLLVSGLTYGNPVRGNPRRCLLFP